VQQKVMRNGRMEIGFTNHDNVSAQTALSVHEHLDKNDMTCPTSSILARFSMA
jgi:hypothetical protein